jgi:pimeloyl-ACP methyl ester carboxylesterase
MEAIDTFKGLQREFLEYCGVNATSRYIQIDNPPMKVHLLESGQGEPIVMIHGGDGEAVNWAQLMAPLQDHVRIYAIDRPGFGLSDPFDYRQVNLKTHAADFVISVLDKLGLDSANLVGSSEGGFFSIAAALSRPQRVRKLILLGHVVGLTKVIPLSLRLIGGVPYLGRLFVKGRDSMRAQKAQYRNSYQADLHKVPDLLLETRIAGMRLPSERETWFQLQRKIASLGGLRPEANFVDDLSNLSMPCLLIIGEYDMAPAEIGKNVLSKIRAGYFGFLPGIGHMPFVEAPEDTARIIIAFLKKEKKIRT